MQTLPKSGVIQKHKQELNDFFLSGRLHQPVPKFNSLDAIMTLIMPHNMSTKPVFLHFTAASITTMVA